MKDLGDRMLFITDASSVSVSARETGGKGNIIYTDKFLEGQYVEFDLNTNSSIIHQIPARNGLCLVSLIPGFFLIFGFHLLWLFKVIFWWENNALLKIYFPFFNCS